MDFTREPIIETIISPKEGYKLAVRNSHNIDQEEYLVHAVEVVSYGSAFFFRSQEKPKAFLLPISDYEVVEVKEARMVLRNVSVEKPIKIGENKEPNKPSQASSNNNNSNNSNNSNSSSNSEDKEAIKNDNNDNKKNQKKRGSKKKYNNAKQDYTSSEKENGQPKVKEVEKTGEVKEEIKLIPPPAIPFVFPTAPKIIGRKLPAPKIEENVQGDIFSDEIEPSDHPLEKEHHEGHSAHLRHISDEKEEFSPEEKVHHFSEEDKKEENS